MKCSCGRESEEETAKSNNDQIDKIRSLCLAGTTPRDPRKKKTECSVPNAKHCKIT